MPGYLDSLGHKLAAFPFHANGKICSVSRRRRRIFKPVINRVRLGASLRFLAIVLLGPTSVLCDSSHGTRYKVKRRA